MNKCLLCDRNLKIQLQIKHILSFKPYFEEALCQRCLKDKKTNEICCEKYFNQNDFYLKQALATIYKPMIDKIHPKLILTYANNNLYDDVAEIIKCTGYKCYSIKQTSIQNNEWYDRKIEDKDSTLIIFYDTIDLPCYKQICYLNLKLGDNDGLSNK